MSEDRKAADAANARGCERAEEFVTYLYGEGTLEESEIFRQHLEACAVCREEFAALGAVREVFGVWRAEALGSLPSLDISETLAPAVATRQTTERKRSASVALREFFSLAPLWLRAGAFAATLTLCALSALTLARADVSWDANGLAFRTGKGAEVVKEQTPAPAPENVYTAEQLDAIVAQRVAEATAQLKEQQRQQTMPESIVNVSDPKVEKLKKLYPGCIRKRK